MYSVCKYIIIKQENVSLKKKIIIIKFCLRHYDYEDYDCFVKERSGQGSRVKFTFMM